MPNYELQCQKCGHTEEYYASFAEFDAAKAKGGVPYPTKCPKCKSSEYIREYGVQIFTETSPEQRRENLKKVMAEDNKKLRSGNLDFIKNIAGDKPLSGKSGVKYMKDVKNSKIKRKT